MSETIDSAMLERIQRSMRLIQEDCEKDALALEGQPLTGLALGTNFGNIFAAVQAVARAVEVLAGGEVPA